MISYVIAPAQFRAITVENGKHVTAAITVTTSYRKYCMSDFAQW